MTASPLADEGDFGPLGCFYAIAIGVLTVTAGACAFSFLTGQSVNLQEEWAVLLFQMLIVAAPFGLLALMGIGRKLPWFIGLGLTMLLWGYVLFDGVTYQWQPDGSGANIGLGLFMLASPILVAAACLGANAWSQRRARARR